MKRFCSPAVLIGFAVLATFPSFVRADKPADALAANHLQPNGSAYVLSDEAVVLDGLKALRKDKKQVDDDRRLRKQYDAKITSSKTTITQNRKEYNELNDRLTVVRDASVHNRMVMRMNMLALKAKEASEAQKEAEDKENEMSIDPETSYVDHLLALGAIADAATEKYTALAADQTVKAAIDRSSPKLALGPSKEFIDGVAELKKWRADVESEAIPLSEGGGVQMVVVLINGQQQKLVLDPGSAFISLPGELAEQLKVTYTDQDPIVKLKLADGTVIEGHRTSLKSVRVGRFSVENVPCVVLAKGLHDASPLLGNSFLSHFVIKIDQKAGQLHLVEVGSTDAATPAKPVTPTSPDKSPGAGGAEQ